MSYPITIDSPSEWLVKVKNYLLPLSSDSEDIFNQEFHKYIASKLEMYFIHSPNEFLVIISKILTEASESGKYVLLEILIHAKSVWSILAQDVNFQPILTELALSSNRLYIKNAAYLSSQLEEYHTISEISIQRIEEPNEKETESVTKKEKKLEEESDYEKSDTSKRVRSEFESLSTLSSPKSPPKMAPPSPISPPEPKPISQVPSSSTSAVTDSSKEVSENDEEFEEEGLLDSNFVDEMLEDMTTSEEIKTPTSFTIHSHVHYYSRMNPRKIYPLTVTLTSLAKQIRKNKTHFLSGEKESEISSEFELTEVKKQIIVEPLLSGCLVQPTNQFVDPNPQKFPRELTFFVTPLVDPGFRGAKLNGTLYIKKEDGTILQKLTFPELTVVNNRISQLAASIGAISGGAMPVFDFLFGINLQATFAAQLAFLLPSLAQLIDMNIVVYTLEVIIFVSALAVGFMWYWKKSRAKIAPDHTMQLSLPA